MAFPPLERLEHIQGAINVPVGQVSMQGKERWTEVIDTAASGACLPGLGPNLVFSRDPGGTAEWHGIKVLIL